MESGPQRFHDNYDTSMEETIKPTPRRSQRSKSTFQDMREQAEMNAPLSPPSSCPMPASGSFDSARMPATSSSFLSLSNANLEYKSDHEYRSPYHSPTHSNVSQFSQPSSPEISQASQAPLFRDADQFESKLTLEEATNSSSNPEPPSSPPSQTQPISSQQSSPRERASSIDSINLEETITDTGITIDDIACYIEGPHPIDQKWDCLYPDCKKRFGRKENIKSHVQTHLGDRQFQCPHCHKCFVRQHDLKRHAKIHSGVKPYPCLCGNSFARHDALTRHRQRGMCIGAFEGVVKKVVKRGRPRKNRPDTEERLEKSGRTRSKNSKAMSSASSTSGYSESSYEHSPPADFDLLDQQPFGEFTANDVFSQNSSMMSSDSFRFSPPPDIQGTCVSPQAIQNAPSPTYSSHSRNNSIASISSRHRPSTPAKSPISTYTPPELCQSSSSPPASVSFYDLQSTNDSLLQDEADKMFLDAFGDNSALDMNMRGLDQDPDLLSLMGNGKFDDSYSGVVGQAEVDAMFGDGAGEDAFFGSP
jgi:regulatory protein SWI5